MCISFIISLFLAVWCCFKKQKKKGVYLFFFPLLHFSLSFPSWPIFGFSCHTYSSLSLLWMFLHGLVFILLCFLNSCRPCEHLNLAILVNWIVYRHSALWLESPICRLDAFSLCLHVPTRVKQHFETVTGSQQSVWDDWTVTGPHNDGFKTAARNSPSGRLRHVRQTQVKYWKHVKRRKLECSSGKKVGRLALTPKKELWGNFERSIWIVNKNPTYPHSPSNFPLTSRIYTALQNVYLPWTDDHTETWVCMCVCVPARECVCAVVLPWLVN